MPSVPPAMNLNSNLVAVPTIMFREPKEGRKSITQIIDWSIPLTNNLSAVNTNLQNNATLEFSQICGLIVDNSDCGADLDFVFPDTDVTISIPAYAPYTVLDVLSNQTQFFIVAHGAIRGDITRYSILNFAPPPVAVPLTVQQQSVAVGNVAIATAATALLGATVNGTLRAINIVAACPQPAASFNALIRILDGSAAVIWAGNVAQQNTGSGFNSSLVNLSNLNRRFSGGLTLDVATTGVPNGNISGNIYYVTP